MKGRKEEEGVMRRTEHEAKKCWNLLDFILFFIIYALSFLTERWGRYVFFFFYIIIHSIVCFTYTCLAFRNLGVFVTLLLLLWFFLFLYIFFFFFFFLFPALL